MKRIIYFIAIIFALPFACDDEDFTPPQNFLDSPSFVATASMSSAEGGDVVTVNVAVTDAPAGVDSIAVSTTNSLGDVTVNSAGIIGQTSGEFTVDVELPFIYAGAFDITVQVYDNQFDEQDNEPARKSFSQTLSVDVSYRFDAPEFTIVLGDASLLSGESTTFTLDITNVAGGSVGSIELLATNGMLDFVQADLDALIGANSGVLTGTFIAGGDTEDATVTATIRDDLQSRVISRETEAFVVCPSSVDLSGSYSSIAHGTTRDGVDYRAIETTVTFTQVNEGQYEVDDQYFGEYTQVRGVATFSGILNICSDDISSLSGTFARHTGKVLDGGNMIEIDFENDAGDTGFVLLTKL